MSLAHFAPARKLSVPTPRSVPLRLARRRIGLDEANEVLQQIVDHIETSPADVGLDLSGVEEATSACVAVLVRAGQIARKMGKKLTLLAISPIIGRLLQLNRLDCWVPVHEDRQTHKPRLEPTSSHAAA